MIRITFFFYCFVGTLVYVLVSFTAGQNGIKCYSQLEEQKREISRQTSIIQNINDELCLEKTALQSDKDVITAYARKLDYVADGEKIVKITGLKPIQNTIYDTGSVLRRKSVNYIPDEICKLLGLSFFVLTFLMFVLIDLSNGNIVISKKEKKTVIQGIPIYDMPQI